MNNLTIGELESKQERFYNLLQKIVDELNKKEIDTEKIYAILNNRLFEISFSSSPIQSKAMNKESHSEIFRIHELRKLNEMFAETITEIALKIETNNQFQDFNKDVLSELNDYINCVSKVLTDFGIVNYSKKYFKSLINA